ncbi:MAG: hypothetical protein ACRDD9_07415 [Shewanella sp.]
MKDENKMKLATSLTLSSLLFTPFTLAQGLFAESAKSTFNDALTSPFTGYVVGAFTAIIIIALIIYAFKD